MNNLPFPRSHDLKGIRESLEHEFYRLALLISQTAEQERIAMISAKAHLNDALKDLEGIDGGTNNPPKASSKPVTIAPAAVAIKVKPPGSIDPKTIKFN